MLETLLYFAISIFIGLLIGIERERNHPESIQFIGVRTFTLFSILGTLIATLNQITLTITTSAFVFSIILLNYFRSTSNLENKRNIGIVTEISAAIIFCIGYMVPSAPLISITISAIVFLVLVERKRLHHLARKKFKPHEIETVIILIIFSLGILPILPNHTIDPWQLFNPRSFGTLIATIAAIQVGGYASIHLFGERFGIALTGFLGGLVSSTAVFATLPDTLRNHPKSTPAIIASGIFSNIAMLLVIMIIIFVASPALLTYIYRPIISMMIVGGSSAAFILQYQKNKIHTQLTPANPLKLVSIFGTSIFIGFMLILITIAKSYVGTEGILIISFLGGLFEIHGISLATALLYLGHQLNISDAESVLYVAILASFISKFIILWSLTPYRFALYSSLFLIAMLMSGGLVYLFFG